MRRKAHWQCKNILVRHSCYRLFYRSFEPSNVRIHNFCNDLGDHRSKSCVGMRSQWSRRLAIRTKPSAMELAFAINRNVEVGAADFHFIDGMSHVLVDNSYEGIVKSHFIII